MSQGEGKPPYKGSLEKKPLVTRHAHDEFELDIDLETDFTELASRPTHDLMFDDEEEVTNEISQEDLAKVIAENSEVDTIIPKASDEKILPMFLPSSSDTPSESSFPPRLEQEVAPPDLSEENLRPSPFHSDTSEDLSESEDFFDDISGVNEKVPFHDLRTPDPDPLASISTPHEQTPSPRNFSKGFTAGMAPLDVSDFSSSDPQKISKGHNSSLPIGRKGAAPMAMSNRVVNRWYQPSVRDVLLFLLLILLGVGIWVGWNIYQDYKKTIGWERFDQGRSSIEQARVDAIESKQPKVQRDIP